MLSRTIRWLVNLSAKDTTRASCLLKKIFMFDRLYNVNKNLTQCLTKFLILFMSFSDSSKTDQPNIGASDEEGPQLPAMLTSLRLNND